MTVDHLFPVLESEPDSELFVQVVSKLACGDVPEEVIDDTWLRRLTALNKPDGGVRGSSLETFIRRLVAKTIAKQVAKKAEKATAPFQCALSTKARCERIAHILQALTDRDANATVVTGWCGLVRPDLQKCNDAGHPEDGRRRSDPPFCAVFLWVPIRIFVGRRDGCHPGYPTRGGTGARRPPHAHVVLVGTTCSVGGDQTSVARPREVVRIPR